MKNWNIINKKTSTTGLLILSNLSKNLIGKTSILMICNKGRERRKINSEEIDLRNLFKKRKFQKCDRFDHFQNSYFNYLY